MYALGIPLFSNFPDFPAFGAMALFFFGVIYMGMNFLLDLNMVSRERETERMELIKVK